MSNPTIYDKVIYTDDIDIYISAVGVRLAFNQGEPITGNPMTTFEVGMSQEAAQKFSQRLQQRLAETEDGGKE